MAMFFAYLIIVGGIALIPAFVVFLVWIIHDLRKEKERNESIH